MLCFDYLWVFKKKSLLKTIRPSKKLCFVFQKPGRYHSASVSWKFFPKFLHLWSQDFPCGKEKRDTCQGQLELFSWRLPLQWAVTGSGALGFTSNHQHRIPAKDGGSRPERGCNCKAGGPGILGRALAQVTSHYFTGLTRLFTASLGEAAGVSWQEEASKESENGRKGNIWLEVNMPPGAALIWIIVKVHRVMIKSSLG